MEDQKLSLANLMTPDVLANPYPFYSALRAAGPTYFDEGTGRWLLTKYEYVVEVFRDPRFSTDVWSDYNSLIGTPNEVLLPIYRHFSEQFLFKDPPKHTQLRQIVNKAFTPRMVELLGSTIQQTVDTLLEKGFEAGKMDLVSDFAQPLSLLTIAAMLGISDMDFDEFRRLAMGLFDFLGSRPDPTTFKYFADNILALEEFMGQVVAFYRQHPSDNFITALINASDNGVILSERELNSTCSMLLGAGIETTTSLISNGMIELIRSPQELQKLRQDWSLLPSAVNELIRYISPIQGTSRFAKEKLSIFGIDLKAGEPLSLLIVAANHDPEVFSNPDTVQIDRQESKSIGFGYGIHHCLGAALARKEAEIAFRNLLERIPVSNVNISNLEYVPTPTFRRLKSLPVQL